MTNLDSILKSRDFPIRPLSGREGVPLSTSHACGEDLKKKKQRHYFANNGPSSQSYGFSSSHVWM